MKWNLNLKYIFPGNTKKIMLLKNYEHLVFLLMNTLQVYYKAIVLINGILSLQLLLFR